MTPEEITNVVKELNEIRDIANADVEKVVGYNTRLQSELDEARAELVERKQALLDAADKIEELKKQRDIWFNKAKTENIDRLATLEQLYAANNRLDCVEEKLQNELNNSVTLQTQRDEARAEMHVYKIRADGHYEDYCEMLRRIDVVVNERDEARAEVEWFRKKDEAACDANKKLRAEVERLKAQILEDQVRCNPYVSLTTQKDLELVTLKDLDRALEERNEIRSELERVKAERDKAKAALLHPPTIRSMVAERDEALAEVARLNEKCGRIADESLNAMTQRDAAREKVEQLKKALECISLDRDEWSAKVERLTAEIQKGNVRYEAALVGLRQTSEQRDEAREARDELREDYSHLTRLSAQEVKKLKIELRERDETIVRLKDELADSTVKQSLPVRPEPSRLEIAVTLMAGLGFFEDVNHDAKLALRAADALIAAAKEGK